MARSVMTQKSDFTCSQLGASSGIPSNVKRFRSGTSGVCSVSAVHHAVFQPFRLFFVS